MSARVMTDDQVIEALRSDSPLNRARREFSSACGRIEQAGQQLSPIDVRRMEFEAVLAIVNAFGPPSAPPPSTFPRALRGRAK